MASPDETRLSKSILHDIIKSVIHYYPNEILTLCKTMPETKSSNILTKDHWKFIESRQEQYNLKYRQVDVVYFFADKDLNPYYIVHEVKTGAFNIDEIYKKYHCGMTVQIWVWAFSQHIGDKPKHASMKIIPITRISNFVLEQSGHAISILQHGETP